MATWNKELHALTKDDVERISLEYLMGWQDLMGNGHPFRIKGFNHMREKYGLEPLTREMSFDYRVVYVREHYTQDEIRSVISEYMRTARVGDTRWTGIELFGCRFGREYARLFKVLLGAHEYRQLAEELRNRKSMETQMARHNGIGLAGDGAMEKAVATNLQRYGSVNVMGDAAVRARLAKTNQSKYGGKSPFCDIKVRQRALQKKNPALFAAMKRYKMTGQSGDVLCESHTEFMVFRLLVDRFGANDVFCQYGIHPSDKRYPFNCDFYIQRLDLFIELNLFFVHGHHWFDATNHDDVLRLNHLMQSSRKMNNKAAVTWSVTDVEKRKKAAASQIKYLVFWGDEHGNSWWASGLPRDFEQWFFDYDCDYARFIADHPENTY